MCKLGIPETQESSEIASELGEHDGLVIKERDYPFGVWSFTGPSEFSSIKVTGSLSTNHGEIAHEWVRGEGYPFRSIWDVRDDLASGKLVHGLPDYFEQLDVRHDKDSCNDPALEGVVRPP